MILQYLWQHYNIQALSNFYSNFMRILFVFILTLSSSLVMASDGEEEGNYYIKMDGTHVSCTIIRYSTSLLVVKDNYGTKMKLKAENIKGFKNNKQMYISAKVAYNYGMKSWNFLEIVSEGAMNLYMIHTHKQVTDDLTKQMYTQHTYVFYVLRSDAPENTEIAMVGGMKWKKKLSELGSDCDEFVKAVDELKYTEWNDVSEIPPLIKVYNDNCSE